MKLVCPAGNLPSLKAAVDHGADAVYMGFKDDTTTDDTKKNTSLFSPSVVKFFSGI